jgi:hypothetical protein
VSNRSLTASRIPSAGRSGRARKIDTRRLSLARASFRGPHACGELDHERDGVSAAPARVGLLPADRLPACRPSGAEMSRQTEPELQLAVRLRRPIRARSRSQRGARTQSRRAAGPCDCLRPNPSERIGVKRDQRVLLLRRPSSHGGDAAAPAPGGIGAEARRQAHAPAEMPVPS